jgi:hypothetical protein
MERVLKESDEGVVVYVAPTKVGLKWKEHSLSFLNFPFKNTAHGHMVNVIQFIA